MRVGWIRESLARAVAHLERGDWQAAHEIVQRDEESAPACWAHGIVHLMEGDAAERALLVRQAGRRRATTSLRKSPRSVSL